MSRTPAEDLPTSRLSYWRWKLDSSEKQGIYKPLEPGKQKYRLLLLHAGSGKDPIHAELQPAQFIGRRGPPYETISYCWGNTNRTVTIQLNGKTISVPASSAAALICARLPDRFRILWIDALCINQSDLDERAQQVAMMAEIFSQSNGNIIYLGNRSALSEQAVNSINRIAADIKQRTQDFSCLDGTPFDHDNPNQFSSDDVSIGIDEKCLFDFFSVGWFGRVWTFQEATLAPSNTCILGHLQLDLLDVVRVAQWINYYDRSYSHTLGMHRGVRCAGSLWNLVDRVLGKYHVQKIPIYLGDILAVSRRLSATEPQDHVYGLLGLWNNGQKRPTQLPYELTPDYRKLVGHVFRDATRAALEEARRLAPWRYISHLDEDTLCSSEYPSWSLDLTQDSEQTGDPNRFHRHFLNADDSGSISQSTVHAEDLNLMRLYGMHLDQIVDVTRVLDLQDLGTRSWALEVVKMVRNCVKETILDDIAMALIAGHDVHGMRATNEDTQLFVDFARSQGEEHRGLVQIEKTTSSTSEQKRATARFWDGVRGICLYRRAFVTRAGYIGIGPKLSQVGDNVVILYGGRTPYVLRPQNDEYRLVGDCYVHGVMNGEAMRRHKDSGDPDTEFKIR